MRFACENCQTRYTVADEKIRGRILKIRCRQCSSIMVVKDPELPPDEAMVPVPTGDSAESSAEGRGADETRQISAAAVQELLKAARAPEPGPSHSDPTTDDATRVVDVASVQALIRESTAEAPSPKQETVDPAARAEELRRAITGGGPTEEWWAIADGEQVGPMSRQRLLDWVRKGILQPSSYVWIDGMADWDRLETVEVLASALGLEPSGAQQELPAEAREAPAPADAPSPAESASVAPEGQDDTVPSLAAIGGEAQVDRDPHSTFPGLSTQETIAAAIAEETEVGEAVAEPPVPQKAPIPPRPAVPWKALRLAGAGALLAASFAAGAWFFVPDGGEPGPSDKPIASASRVVLADFELPDRAPLDRTAVGEALASRVPGFSRCVETHPPATGQRRISMRAVVAPSGTVTSASVSSGDPGGELAICLADRTRDIRFPPFKGEALVLNFPLLLVGNP